MRISKNIIFYLILIFSAFSANAGDLDADLRDALESIRPMAPYEYCKMLSSDRFSGRLTGHTGYTEAARWAAEKFKSWGLAPPDFKEGYLQPFPAPYTLLDHAEMILFFREPNEGDEEAPVFKEIRLEPGKDFLPLVFSGSGNKKAGLVFAGWGINAPDLDYDDYAGMDVRGKFVLCFRGTPDPDRPAYEPYDHHRTRMKTAQEKGALGLIYIYPDVHAHPNGDWIADFMPAMINEETADKILKEKTLKASDLKKHLRTFCRPLSFALQSQIQLKVESRHFPDGVGYNVAGYIEGSDPRLREECVVIGAHLDHCGCHMGFHFAGADDNASGSAAVMAAAGAFSRLGTKPKRPVLFVLFGGEEMGLLGSTHFADHLPSPFSQVDAMFNLDMVGEGDGTGCAYSAEPPELKAVLESSDQQVHTLKKTHIIKRIGVRSSDFAPFFQKGVPCASFWSNGPHLHYHQTGDTIYRINPDMLADAARLVFLSAYTWADR